MCKASGGGTMCSVVPGPSQDCLLGLTTNCYPGRQVAKPLMIWFLLIWSSNWDLVFLVLWSQFCNVAKRFYSSQEPSESKVTWVSCVQYKTVRIFVSFCQEVEIISQYIFQELGTWKSYSIFRKYFRVLYNLIQINSSKLCWFCYVDLSGILRFKDQNLWGEVLFANLAVKLY